MSNRPRAARAADRQDNREGTEAPNRPGAGSGTGIDASSPAPKANAGDSGVAATDAPRADSLTLAAAEKQTRKLARSHYENFVVASVLLPRRLRQPFYNVYAFCRTADDLADESESREEALRGLQRLGAELDAAYRGQPRDPLLVALADTIERFELPREPFDDLLDAFGQDQRKRRYDNFDQLLDYCRRSANPVGRIVLRLAGCFDAARAGLSDQICTGLQLANFWQDVARDHAIGRIYLPADEMRQFGVTEADLRRRSASPPLRELLRFQCERAEGFLCRGLPLADDVPKWLAGDVRLFAHGGLSTLAAIRRARYDVLRRRPTVSRSRQLWLLARVVAGRLS